MNEISTINDQGVAIHGNNIVLLVPKRSMSKPEALRLAAWLVALAQENDGEFQAVYDAVMDC